MKHKLLLTVATMFSVAVAFAQKSTDRITANISGRPLSEAVSIIENVSRFTFFYDTAKTDMTRTVSLSAVNLTIEDAKNMIINNFHPGEIMLLHPNSKTNSEVLDTIIKEAQNQGYAFKKLEEFI